MVDEDFIQDIVESVASGSASLAHEQRRAENLVAKLGPSAPQPLRKFSLLGSGLALGDKNDGVAGERIYAVTLL